jgi:two-component system, chemotaxis family, sensor kinase Cph1
MFTETHSMQTNQALPYPFEYDLLNCGHEPLNFIATIQAHAFLLACTPQDWVVTQVSSNISDLLNFKPSEILGTPLFNYLPQDSTNSIFSGIAKGCEYLATNPVRVIMPVSGPNKWFNCLIHFQSDGTTVFEFEQFDDDTITYNMQRSISEAMQRIQFSESLLGVFQTSAEEVKKITGYDRVMVYRFDADGNGSVVAEAKEPELESLFGLRYPASDIPPQARELFMKNPARIISDVNATPAQLIPPISNVTGQPLDLTHCVGRGVSPIHLEYLSNMGVRATMSIAIVFEEKLWGLIACHHYSPRFTGHFKRNATWFLGKIISTHLGMQSNTSYRESVMRANLIKSKLFEQMAVSWDLFEGLTTGSNNMLDLLDCGGGIIYHEGRIELLGKTPPKEAVQDLIAWLENRPEPVVFHTNELPKFYIAAQDWKDTGSGILAVRLTNRPSSYLIWFRPEVVQTIHWGGNPDKAVFKDSSNLRLSPRKSFEKWAQMVENTSQPWQSYEVDTAVSLHNDVKDFIFQKYNQNIQTNKELTQTNEDFETFSYSISHDLRAPLRRIEEFSEILKNQFGEALGNEGNQLIDAIKGNASKMNQLIADLLAYTRAGRKNLTINAVSLETVVMEEVKPLMEEALRQGRSIKLQINGNLPNVMADKVALTIIMKNLLSNAFKYSANSCPAEIEVGGERSNEFTTFYVKDNGIGFDMRNAGLIFRIFHRLVNEEEYMGTGIGLAIVKRIVERHGGTISVDSFPGKGTSFLVRLPHHTF